MGLTDQYIPDVQMQAGIGVVGNGDLVVVVLDPTYTWSPTDATLADVAAHEVAGAGYVRATMTATVAVVGGVWRAVQDSTPSFDLTGSARGGVMIARLGVDDASSPLVRWSPDPGDPTPMYEPFWPDGFLEVAFPAEPGPGGGGGAPWVQVPPVLVPLADPPIIDLTGLTIRQGSVPVVLPAGSPPDALWRLHMPPVEADHGLITLAVSTDGDDGAPVRIEGGGDCALKMAGSGIVYMTLQPATIMDVRLWLLASSPGQYDDAAPASYHEGGGGGGVTAVAAGDGITVDPADPAAPVVAVDSTVVRTTDGRLTDARPPTTHTHTAAQISDATTAGRSILTAADLAAVRTLLYPGVGQVRTASVSGAVTVDATVAEVHRLTLTGPVTLTLTPGATVASVTIVAIQDATGGRTITWPAGLRWTGGTAPAQTTTPGGRDRWMLATESGGTSWDVVAARDLR